MRFTVQNDSQSPRLVYHGGRGTTVPAASAVNVDMTQEEAENAKADGVMISEAKAGAPAPEKSGKTEPRVTKGVKVKD